MYYQPHIHDLIDFTVSAYIVHPDLDKVLLIHHKKLNKWLQIGGHVELDEDTDQALFREIREECGLEVVILSKREGPTGTVEKALYRPNFLSIHQITETHRHLDLKFVAVAKDDKVALAPREHNEIRWFSRADLESKDSPVDADVSWHWFKALEMAQKANMLP